MIQYDYVEYELYEPAELSRAGYLELLRCVSKTTGEYLDYAEVCQVAPGFVRAIMTIVENNI